MRKENNICQQQQKKSEKIKNLNLKSVITTGVNFVEDQEVLSENLVFAGFVSGNMP